MKTIDFLGRFIYLFHIANIKLFGIIRGKIVTRTHSLNWLWNMVHKLHYCIMKMFLALFNGFAELPDTKCLWPCLKHNWVDGEFLLALDMHIQYDTIHYSLRLIYYAVRIPKAHGNAFSLTFWGINLESHTHVGSLVYCLITLVFRSRFHLSMSCSKYAFGTGCLSSDFLQ